MKIDLTSLTISKAHAGLMGGEFTVVDLVNTYLENIKEKDSDLNVYREVFEDAIEQAKIADEKIKNRENINPLIGIPFSIKDNILIDGRKAGAASKILEGYVSPYDSTVIEKLKKSGAIFIGRTNMDEFAMGGSTENSAYGVTKNPLDNTKVAGGSSGGSAASIAANFALASLGSDTGGSIRQPAAFCNVVGLKPTYGAVSRHGLMAMGSSLDVIGPFGKCVEDVEIIFNAIKGEDQYDSTSSFDEKNKDIKVIGVPKGILDMGGIDQGVRSSFQETLNKLKEIYEVVEIDLPNLSYSLAVYYVLMPAEVSSNMARFDGMKYGKKVEGEKLIDDYVNTRGELLGKEVRRRIMLGTYVLSSGYYDAYYTKANKVREILKKDFEAAFMKVDAIITPTAPTEAFKIGEKTKDPLSMYLEDIFTVPGNLVGIPAISVPKNIQIMASHYHESVLFEIGKEIEKLR